MDAKTKVFKMYTEFKRYGRLPDQDKITTENQFNLVALMREIVRPISKDIEEKSSAAISGSTSADVATPRMRPRNMETPRTLASTLKTPSDEALAKRIDSRKARTVELNGRCFNEWQLYTDMRMAQRSRPRIDAFIKNIDQQVSMDWVHAWASTVTPTPNTAEVLNKFQTLRGSSTHEHIVSNSVTEFVCVLHRAAFDPPQKITTFSWTHDSKHAVHLQKLGKQLKIIFDENTVMGGIGAMAIVCSIGLPLHELFKPSDFMEKMKSYRFKKLSTNALVKVALRGLVTIDKINNEVEANQLLKAYEQKEEFFAKHDYVAKDASQATLDMFVFKNWYSYPTKTEIECIFKRTSVNIGEWCTVK